MCCLESSEIIKLSEWFSSIWQRWAKGGGRGGREWEREGESERGSNCQLGKANLEEQKRSQKEWIEQGGSRWQLLVFPGGGQLGWQDGAKGTGRGQRRAELPEKGVVCFWNYKQHTNTNLWYTDIINHPVSMFICLSNPYLCIYAYMYLIYIYAYIYSYHSIFNNTTAYSE